MENLDLGFDQCERMQPNMSKPKQYNVKDFEMLIHFVKSTAFQSSCGGMVPRNYLEVS